MNSNKTVIEINGVKMEIDLRCATRIEHMQVGSRVKVLKKQYSDYKVYHGIIIGFEPFKQLPTIIIAAVNIEYNQAKIDYVYYNSESKDIEICVAVDDDIAALSKDNFCKAIEREVAQKQREIEELEQRKSYFLANFQSYWTPVEQAVADATDGVDEF